MAIVTYSVGYLVGFIVPLFPGGLGAREGTLVAVLASRYSAGAATGIALMTLLAVTIGEAFGWGSSGSSTSAVAASGAFESTLLLPRQTNRHRRNGANRANVDISRPDGTLIWIQSVAGSGLAKMTEAQAVAELKKYGLEQKARVASG